MFDTAKMYIVAIISAIVFGFMAVFKYRGMKIEQQESEIEEKESEIKAVKQYHEAKDKVQDFEAGNRVAKAKAEAKDAEDITPGVHTI